MDMKESIITCLRKSFTKKGRASRSEFWWFALLVFLVSTVVQIVIGDAMPQVSKGHPFMADLLLELVAGLFLIYAMVAFYFAQTRRLHDVGRSGWWLVTALIIGLLADSVMVIDVVAAVRAHEIGAFVTAFVAGQYWGLTLSLVAVLVLNITVFVFLVLPGTAGDNRYGQNPLTRNT